MEHSNQTNTIISDAIAKLVTTLPANTLQQLASHFESSAPQTFGVTRATALALVNGAASRTSLLDLFTVWQQSNCTPDGRSIALAFRSAMAVQQQRQSHPDVELVWTGPETRSLVMRRTDQALLQLLQQAQKSLLIVSFAVYDIPEIVRALEIAIQRGVQVSVCLESPDISAGRTALQTLRTASPTLSRMARFYIWPAHKRALENGHRGVLHAKVAVADDQAAFISSANLTNHAMTVNIELGVMIHGSGLPGVVRRQFEELIERGVFEGMK